MFRSLANVRNTLPKICAAFIDNNCFVNNRFFRMAATDYSNGDELITDTVQEKIDSTPFTTEDDAKEIIKSMYNMNAIDIKRFDSYDDLNFYIKTDDGGGRGNEFVLKVFNKQLSLDEGMFEAHTELLIRLQNAGITAPVPLKDINGKKYSLEHLKKTKDGVVVREGDFMVRLLTYIPGEMLVKAKQIPLDLFYDVGKTLARIHNAWRSYQHPSLIREDFEWQLRLAPNTRAFAHLPKEEWQRNMSTAVLDKFETEVLPNYHKLSRGIIHGDLNELNVLVNQSKDSGKKIQPSCTLSGVLDVGDAVVSPYIFDVGISLAYMMLTDIEESATADVCKWFLSGYESVSKLPDSEVNAIVTIMSARLVQSLLFGLHYYSVDPTKVYALSTQDKGWQALKNVSKISIEDIQKAECQK